MVVLTSFPPPVDGIRHQQSNTSVLMNERNLGKGTLYIAESRVSWVNSSSGEGFSLEYPHICLHAISRTPVECLYMMLDTSISPKLGDEDVDNDDDKEDDEDENEDDENTVMKFLPDDTASLDAMYQAMSQCQALNPDPQDSDSDPENIFLDADGDEGEEGEVGNHVEDNDDEGIDYEEASNGQANNDTAAMEVDSAQFEDADSDIDN